ncbi:MAG: DUF3035 domain-containing protein [Alphaproteobacteria bacterium]
MSMKTGNLALICVAGCIAAVSLGGCSGAKRAFGMQKVTPDEFTVVTKPPLVLPPDYSLRPPQPGAPNPAVITPSGNAELALFGRDGQLSDNAQGYTSGEVSLLETTGGSGANPNIRQVVNAETASLVEKDSSVAEKILFWQEPSEAPAAVINPVKEAERLKGAKPTATPDAEAAKPAAKPEEKGWFDGLF